MAETAGIETCQRTSFHVSQFLARDRQRAQARRSKPLQHAPRWRSVHRVICCGLNHLFAPLPARFIIPTSWHAFLFTLSTFTLFTFILQSTLSPVVATFSIQHSSLHSHEPLRSLNCHPHLYLHPVHSGILKLRGSSDLLNKVSLDSQCCDFPVFQQSAIFLSCASLFLIDQSTVVSAYQTFIHIIPQLIAVGATRCIYLFKYPFAVSHANRL